MEWSGAILKDKGSLSLSLSHSLLFPFLFLLFCRRNVVIGAAYRVERGRERGRVLTYRDKTEGRRKRAADTLPL